MDSYIELFDAFGYEINFRYRRNKRYRSRLGGAFSSISFAFILYLFYYFSQDCFNKTNPNVTIVNTFNNTVKLNSSSFVYAIYFTDTDNIAINNPQKYLSFHGIITEWGNNKKEHPINFSKCEISKHFNKSNILENRINQKLLNYDKTYCLDLPKDFEFLNGRNEIPRKSLRIYVMECMNKTMFQRDCMY